MNLSRAVILSTIYGLKDQLHYEGVFTVSGNGPDEAVVDILTRDQVYDSLRAPSIVVYPSTQFENDLQLGGGYWLNTLMTFDVYGRSDGEMYRLVDTTRHYLETTSTVKNYETGFPEYQVLDGKLRETYSGAVPLTLGMMYFADIRVQYLDRVTLVGETRAHRAQVVAVIQVTTC